MNPDVVIIGAGVAGLSAAVELSVRGKRVLVLEQHQDAGGRTRSFRDEVTGDTVDNGQHLLMGCYRHTRRYLRLIGSEHLAELQSALTIPYLRAGAPAVVFRCPRLPAPFHLLGGIARFTALPRPERAAVSSVAHALLFTSPERLRKLDMMSADAWLTQLGQGPEARRYLWDVITIGALNDHPANVSALLLYRVLRTAFSGRRENASLMIPRVGLSELLVEPAIRFVRSRGGDVRLGTGAARFVAEGNRISGIRTTAGETLHASGYVSAVPWYASAELLQHDVWHGPDLARHFIPSPIISVQLWYDRPVMDGGFAAVLDRTIQWIFARTGKNSRQHLSLIISGASALATMEKERLIAIARDDLAAVLPRTAGVVPDHSLVIKEKRATFVPRPGLEGHRPASATAFSNLALAGDWTNTGFPATIEGAILSGVRAATIAGGKRYIMP